MQRRARVLVPLKTSAFFILRPTIRSLYLGNHFTGGSLNEIQLALPVPLAGRKYLPCSDYAGFPKFLSGPRENFPLLAKARNRQQEKLTLWAKRSKEVIEEAFRKYEEDGTSVAILFRDLPIRNEKDFAEWVNGLGYEAFSYVGGIGKRVEIAQNVASGAKDAKEYTIDLHSDMAYNVDYPKMFAISNLKTAPYGGETAICDVREVLGKLEPSFVEKCERKGIRYCHIRPDEKTKEQKLILRSWQEQFQTEDKSDVENYLNDKGYGFEWDGTTLMYWNNLNPFTFHPITGERLWFNQMAHIHCTYYKYSPRFEGLEWPNKKYPTHTTYGDGEEIELEMIYEVKRASWESAVGFQWKEGDVLFIDQLIVQHSRLSYHGDRKVGVSLLTY